MSEILANARQVLYDRHQDVETYFNTLRHESMQSVSDEVAILRATTVLLFYNMIEATIKNLFLDYYRALGQRPFEKLNVELQKLYIDLKLTENDPYSAKHDTYIKKSEEIIRSVLSSEGVFIPVSRNEEFKKVNKGGGNLDVSTIQKLFNIHGIDLSDVDFPSCISRIKQERNDLSHGSKTFLEIGRKKSLRGSEDTKGLEDDKQEIKMFLDKLIAKIEETIDEHYGEMIAV